MIRKYSPNKNSVCNYCLVVNGNWKVGRPVCISADVLSPSEEFGDLGVGCRLSPEHGSYYCAKHTGDQVKYKYYTDLKCMNPTSIINTRMRT
jgi:hypothetical protein